MSLLDKSLDRWYNIITKFRNQVPGNGMPSLWMVLVLSQCKITSAYEEPKSAGNHEFSLFRVQNVWYFNGQITWLYHLNTDTHTVWYSDEFGIQVFSILMVTVFTSKKVNNDLVFFKGHNWRLIHDDNEDVNGRAWDVATRHGQCWGHRPPTYPTN